MSVPLQVTIGSRDVTGRIEALTFSNTDPGGFEALSMSGPSLAGVRPGDRVTVRYGLAVAWDGRINEPGEIDRHGQAQYELAATGYHARLSDSTYREVYMDRDLTHWRGPSLARVNARAGTFNAFGPGEPRASGVAGSFGLYQDTLGPMNKPEPCAYYDQGVPLGGVAANSIDAVGLGGADMHVNGLVVLQAFGANDNDFLDGTADLSLQLAAGTGVTWNVVGGVVTSMPLGTNIAEALWHYSVAGSGGSGSVFAVIWNGLAVWGQHGLTGANSLAPGTTPPGADFVGGFWPNEIVRHAHSKAGSPFALCIGAANAPGQLLMEHLVYLTPTTPRQVINDAAHFQAWHWGVWEPAGALDDTPTLWFGPRPTDATAFVARALCDELRIPKARLDLLYDRVQVTHTDPATGLATHTVVTLPNSQLVDSGVGSRTLELQLSQASPVVAQQFGYAALGLGRVAARGGGSCVLPAAVATPSGYRPSCLLKAGRDRLRITDLPDAGAVTEADTRRYDTFRVARVETTVGADGVPRTRAEFDGGADLLEILQSKLESAGALV